MELSNILINTRSKFGTEIIVDGINMKFVRALSFEREVDGIPILKLENLVANVTITGESTVKLNKIPKLAQGGIISNEDSISISKSDYGNEFIAHTKDRKGCV